MRREGAFRRRARRHRGVRPSSRRRIGAAPCAPATLGRVRGLYVVAAVVMAGTSAVFVLLAELEHRYDLSTGSLGLIAGSAFAAALATQLGLARYADRGYGLVLLRAGVALA